MNKKTLQRTIHYLENFNFENWTMKYKVEKISYESVSVYKMGTRPIIQKPVRITLTWCLSWLFLSAWPPLLFNCFDCRASEFDNATEIAWGTLIWLSNFSPVSASSVTVWLARAGSSGSRVSALSGLLMGFLRKIEKKNSKFQKLRFFQRFLEILCLWRKMGLIVLTN